MNRLLLPLKLPISHSHLTTFYSDISAGSVTFCNSDPNSGVPPWISNTWERENLWLHIRVRKAGPLSSKFLNPASLCYLKIENPSILIHFMGNGRIWDFGDNWIWSENISFSICFTFTILNCINNQFGMYEIQCIGKEHSSSLTKVEICWKTEQHRSGALNPKMCVTIDVVFESAMAEHPKVGFKCLAFLFAPPRLPTFWKVVPSLSQFIRK